MIFPFLYTDCKRPAARNKIGQPVVFFCGIFSNCHRPVSGCGRGVGRVGKTYDRHSCGVGEASHFRNGFLLRLPSRPAVLRPGETPCRHPWEGRKAEASGVLRKSMQKSEQFHAGNGAYSVRSAITGSLRAALRDGIRPAISDSAMLMNISTIAAGSGR